MWLCRLLGIAALSVTGPLGIDGLNAQAAPPMSGQAAELDEFEQRVREYLLTNPEVIMEALQVLQQRQRAAETENLKRTIAERGEEILNDPAAPVGGNPAGDVTLVEFFDYNCPYCRRVAPTVVELEQADPDLRLVYKELPILGPGSQFAARAALASRQQGKYVAFHNALMQATEQVTEEAVMETARAVGLDTEQLRADMQDPAIQEAIGRNLQLANALVLGVGWWRFLWTTGLGILPITVASVALGDRLTGPMWDVWLVVSGLVLALYLGWRWYGARRGRHPREGMREARSGRSP